MQRQLLRAWGLGGRRLPLAALAACFSTSGSGTLLPDPQETAAALRAHSFHSTYLASLAASRSSIPYLDLLREMRGRGFTPTAAEDVISRLEKSGMLLNMAGTVLLRPGEVAEALALVLPCSAADTRQRLARVQQELAVLEKLMEEFRRDETFWRRMVIGGGVAGQTAIYGGMWYFTYEMYSWDVMEPIGYLLGGVQASAALLYFALTREDFSWWRATTLQPKKKLSQRGFNHERYRQLKSEEERLLALLAAQEQQEAAAAAADAPAGGDAQGGGGAVAHESPVAVEAGGAPAAATGAGGAAVVGNS